MLRLLLPYLSLFLLATFAGACGPDGAPNAQKVIREQHEPEIKRILAEDLARHLVGVKAAGERIAPGFVAVAEPKARESQMRTALRLLTKLPRGIPELVASARTFIAAVEPSGSVIATDAKEDKDRMTGVNLGERFAIIRDALAGTAGYAVDVFPALEEGGEGSVSLLFAAPAHNDGRVVGAALVGIPLWRLSQRFTKQLQLEHVAEKGAILWVYLYRGDKLHHFGTPPDLDTMIPDAAARKANLAKQPGGYTSDFLQFGRWYALGVFPMPELGEDAGVIIVRSDPV